MSARGFTMLEMLIALALLGLMSAVLFGSLNLAGKSYDVGEAKAEATTGMRLAGDYLRTQLAAQHPQRMRKIAEFPLLFAGERDELRYTAQMPGRVGLAGIWYFRLVVAKVPGRVGSALVLERIVPDLDGAQLPTFDDGERSVLADDVEDVKLRYYGRDPGAALDAQPSWRERWNDPQALPLLIEAVVTPKRGEKWPALVVAPRTGPEAGCRSWDAQRLRCAGL